jgi:putative DNA primase/helicase
MNFQNGVLDVRTETFTEGNQKDLGFMFTLDFNYDAKATAPVFEKFLEAITCGDSELRQLLLEFGGYAISNDEYWEHKALLLVGDGSNGKNTFVQVLKDLAGNGYASVAMKNLGNEQHLARLEGKLFNFSEEASVKGFYDTDAFKTICSGGEINVKTVYEKPYDITNRAKIIIACNDIPPSTDRSYGFFRRFAVAPFNATFTEENRDVQITKRLKAERAGILNLLLEAYRGMKTRGHLTSAKSGREKLEEYKIANDPMLQWMQDVRVVPRNEDIFTKNEDLYTSYGSHCMVDGVRPISRVSFFMRLAKLVPESDDRRKIKFIAGKTERVWLGVSLENGGAF